MPLSTCVGIQTMFNTAVTYSGLCYCVYQLEEYCMRIQIERAAYLEALDGFDKSKWGRHKIALTRLNKVITDSVQPSHLLRELRLHQILSDDGPGHVYLRLELARSARPWRYGPFVFSLCACKCQFRSANPLFIKYGTLRNAGPSSSFSTSVAPKYNIKHSC